MTMRKTIAVCNDRALVREGKQLLVVPRGGAAAPVLVFVLGLVSFILSANAVVWVIATMSDLSYWKLALLLSALATVAVTLLVHAVRWAKSMWTEPYGADPILIIDLDKQT